MRYLLFIFLATSCASAERQFIDDSIRCLEFNSQCGDNGSVFKDDELLPPDSYYEDPSPVLVEDLEDPPHPFPDEENPSA